MHYFYPCTLFFLLLFSLLSLILHLRSPLNALHSLLVQHEHECGVASRPHPSYRNYHSTLGERSDAAYVRMWYFFVLLLYVNNPESSWKILQTQFNKGNGCIGKLIMDMLDRH